MDRACLLVRDRVRVLSELPELTRFLFKERLDHDPSQLTWKTQSKAEALERLQAVRTLLDERPANTYVTADLEKDLRQFIVDRGWGNGDTLWPLRVALSAQKQSPGPFELLATYGKSLSLARIDEAIAKLVS
jgi:glutamyl-tRNA synthetase